MSYHNSDKVRLREGHCFELPVFDIETGKGMKIGKVRITLTSIGSYRDSAGVREMINATGIFIEGLFNGVKFESLGVTALPYGEKPKRGNFIQTNNLPDYGQRMLFGPFDGTDSFDRHVALVYCYQAWWNMFPK